MTHTKNVLNAHPSNCHGTCCLHESIHLMPSAAGGFKWARPSILNDDVRRFEEGESLWNIFGDDMMALDAKVVAEYSANRETIDAAAAAAVAAFACRNKAERTAIRVGALCTKRKQVIQKVAQPCKFLYNCQGSPARPTTMHVSSECWSHEYVDPKTGELVAKHVCDRMHPGEEGWLPQWNTDRLFKAAVAAVRNWDHGDTRTKRSAW